MASSGLSSFPMLASLVMATPAADAEEDCTACTPTKDASPFFVENTFIAVFDEDYYTRISSQQKRRSNSAPPTCRSPPNAYGSCDSVGPMTCIPCNVNSPCAMSVASTASREDSDDEFSCFAESSDDGSPCNPELAAAMKPEVDLPVGRNAVRLALSDLLQGPPRASLNAKAKAWTSIGPANVSTQMRRGVAEVVAAAQTSLMAASGIEKVQTSETPLGGTSLVANIRSTQYGQTEAALNSAGEAMLAAASRSENMYVIGYERHPFKALQNGTGFCVQLAMVLDENQACWDLLAKGVCARGCSCKWQHPTCQTMTNVSLEIIRAFPT